MTSLTTAIGFLSLLSSRMPPIRSFGLYAAIGVFIAFGSAILLTIAFLPYFSDRHLIRPRRRPLFTSTVNFLESLTFRYPRSIVVGTLLFLLLAVVGAGMTSFNLLTQRDFPRSSKALADFQQIDLKMQGVNTMDIAVRMAGDETRFYALQVLRKLEEFEVYLSSLPETGKVASPLLFFKILNYSFSGLDPAALRLPDSQADLDLMVTKAREYFGDALGTILSEDGRRAWVYVKIPDIGSRNMNQLKSQIQGWTDANLDASVFEIRQTGARHIFDVNQELLVMSLLKSMGIAFVLVSIFMGLIFRDLRIVLISLIPNVVPLIATAGMIGFFGFAMDPKVAIVFTVAFGIAVDDSIHFLSRFKLERDYGNSVDEAISVGLEL